LHEQRLRVLAARLPEAEGQYPFPHSDIERLKVERDEVNSELSIDRNDLAAIEGSLAQLARQIDERMTFIREKERQLMELEKAIN
jgi:chromosome segregation ATPase